MWHPLVAILLLGSVLTACTDSDDNPIDSGQETVTGDDASDKMAFKLTPTTVNDNGKSTRTVTLRYYEDMPHVAYISVSDFLTMVKPTKNIRVSKTAASQYKLVTNTGETAVVNTVDESMIFDDYMSFVSLDETDSEGFLKTNDVAYFREKLPAFSPAAASVTFNMKKYGIDLRGDGQMVYVPLSTLSDLYSGPSNDHVLFNGETIMLTDFITKPATIDASFIKKPYEMTERPADLAAYSYGELCFAIDHFYGMPGRNAIEKTIQEKGLSQALSENARKLLQSTKMDEYVFGMEYLGALLNDGGHTLISPTLHSFAVSMDQKQLSEYLNKYITAFSGQYPQEAQAAMAIIMQNDSRSFAVQNRQKFYGTNHYVKIGNTVYCIYDAFGPIDQEGWKAYYDGSGPKPAYNLNFVGDICGIVEALDKAAADPEVKNFVLDLTCNGGGDSNVLLSITNLLAGKNTFTYENILTKQHIISETIVDSNFDRVFDDKDKAPRHPELNIAIMPSHYAFSSGNLLPSLMKDYGYLIIGEKSGGGSCSIQYMCTAEGFCYVMSSARARVFNKAGDNIDPGIEPHIALEVKQAVGKGEYAEVKYSDFSAFYDPSIGDQIVSWYANKR